MLLVHVPVPVVDDAALTAALTPAQFARLPESRRLELSFGRGECLLVAGERCQCRDIGDTRGRVLLLGLLEFGRGRSGRDSNRPDAGVAERAGDRLLCGEGPTLHGLKSGLRTVARRITRPLRCRKRIGDGSGDPDNEQ
jgi:hypothetical protein